MKNDTVSRVRAVAAAALGATLQAYRPSLQAAADAPTPVPQRSFTPLSLTLAVSIRRIHLVREDPWKKCI